MRLLHTRPKLIAGLVVLALFAAGGAYQAFFGNSEPLGLHVEGNDLVDRGEVVRLLGVEWPGTADECARSGRPFGAPTDARAIRAVQARRANAVRVPLNADCWLGLGAAYRDAIAAFVTRLHGAGLYVVLALDRPAARMPGTARAEQFWRGVARTFEHDHALVFDLYGEPHGVDWFCWRDGCRDPAGGPRLSGMQLLVDAVRDEDAHQPLLVRGLDRGDDLAEWLDQRPDDPDRQLVAGFRTSASSRCSTRSCWDAIVARVAKRAPLVAEAGAPCDTRFLAWADGRGVSYLSGGCRAVVARHLAALHDGTLRPAPR